MDNNMNNDKLDQTMMGWDRHDHEFKSDDARELHFTRKHIIPQTYIGRLKKAKVKLDFLNKFSKKCDDI